MNKIKKIFTIILACMIMSVGVTTISEASYMETVESLSDANTHKKIFSAINTTSLYTEAFRIYTAACTGYVLFKNPYKFDSKDYVDLACELLGAEPF